MERLLVEPGRRFFPLVGELSEELETMKTDERQRILREHPFRPCGTCEGGMIALNRDGTPHDPRKGGPRYMAECRCKREWRQRIEAATGDGAEPSEQSRLIRMPYREPDS
jgi:hypothetical protein